VNFLVKGGRVAEKYTQDSQDNNPSGSILLGAERKKKKRRRTAIQGGAEPCEGRQGGEKD